LATRIGVELSPAACRIVELEGDPIDPGRLPATRIRSYRILPAAGPEIGEALAALKGHSVALVLWGVRSEHRQVMVAAGSSEEMREEALTGARAAGLDALPVLADVAPVGTAPKDAAQQPAVLVLASTPDVSAAMEPLVAAGVRIHSLLTPADALLGLARSRQAFAVPGGIEAYVAMDQTASCLALVRDASLLSARELAWGYLDGGADAELEAAGPRRDDLASRLADELGLSLTGAGAEMSGVTRVAICSGLPELQTVTVPLMARLDVEVEALDSLFGIDVDRLLELEGDFAPRASELRLAWAAAADWNGPINLMRQVPLTRSRRAVAPRVAAAVAVGVGLATGWAILQTSRSPSAPPSMATREPARAPLPGATAGASDDVPLPSPAPIAPAPQLQPAPSPAVAEAPGARPTPVAAPPAETSAPLSTPPAPVPPAPAPARTTSSAAVAQRAPDPPPAPLAAVIGTILYSPDRKLAIVDNRIVGIGDEVNGAQVVDITANTVLLRDARGRPRIITMGPAPAPPAAR
jgi:hypothetical protein